jgi:glutamate racemase
MKIGVFDSGLGGLSILKSLIEYSPNNEYIYFGDTLNLPYGDKKVDELYELSKKIMKFFESHKVDCVVMACGTLSSTVYERIKKESKIPVYDIINPIVKALKRSNAKKVLLLGTEKTIQAKLFEEKLNSIGIDVYTRACSKFVPILENRSNEDLRITIAEYLYDFKGLGIDLIIPGCTHFVLISEEMSEFSKIPCLDIGLLIAGEINPEYSINDLKVYFSKVTPEVEEVTNAILGDTKIVEKVL